MQEPKFLPIGLRWVVGTLILILGLSAFGSWLFSRSLVRQQADVEEKTEKRLPISPIDQTLTPQNGPVFSLAISPDGNTFVSGGGDRNIQEWNLKTGKLLHTFSAHRGPVVSVAISPDGKRW